MRGYPFLLGLPAAVALFTAFSAFLAVESRAKLFRFARRHARLLWLFVAGALGLASIPELWNHGADASDLSMFLAGAFCTSISVYILASRGALDPREWVDYPPAPVPAGQIRGFFSVDPRVPHFAVQRGRRWFGLRRRVERWEYEFAANCQLPDAIRDAQLACDKQQTYSVFEVDIQATLGEQGRFGPEGWCSRHVTIHSITRVGRAASTTPGPFIRKLWGLPPEPPME